jgi:hypothetical protein
MMAKSLFSKNHVEGVPSRRWDTRSVRCVGARSLVAAILGVTTLVAFVGTDAYAATLIPAFGAVSPYAVLEASSGTAIGVSNVIGNVGIVTASSAGASAGQLGTGLLSGVGNVVGSLLGNLHGSTGVSTGAASSAEGVAASIYGAVASESPSHVVGSELNGLTLTPGVYASSGPLALVGRIVLDASGVKNPNFIFQVPSNLTTAPGAQVVLGAGVRASDVLWQIGGATSVAAGAKVVGTILSEGPITLAAGVALVGRALSLTGAVNLDHDSISVPLGGATVVAGVPAVANATVPAVGVPSVAATPPLSVGLGTPSLSAVLHLLGTAAGSLPTLPTVGSAASGAPTSPSVGVGLPTALPFIPLQDIGVPELAVPTLPIGGIGVPTVTAPTTTVPSTPSVPSLGTALPVASLPVPLGGTSLPTVTTPTTTAPSTPSVPSLGTALPAVSLPLPLSGTSLPQLTTPTLASPSSPASGVELPSITLPSISPASVSLPHLTTPSTSTGKGTIVHGRVRESAPPHSSVTSHAKSTTTTIPGSGSTIPVGAPQTGFGGMAGSMSSRFLLALSALVLAACAGTFAVRSRRYQRG